MWKKLQNQIKRNVKLEYCRPLWNDGLKFCCPIICEKPWMSNTAVFFPSFSCRQWSVEPAFLPWHCFDCGVTLRLSDWLSADVRHQRGKKKKKSTLPLTEVGMCAMCASVRAYRRSFLLRRKSFLVCAISASLGRGGKTCRETNHGVRDSCCQERRYRWLCGKMQSSSSLL